MVAHQQNLGSRSRRGGKKAQQRGILAHRSFVQDDDVAAGQRELAAVQAPGERGQGARHLDAGLTLRVLAAWPDVDVPMTSKPSASKASRTAASAVVFPEPARPTISSVHCCGDGLLGGDHDNGGGGVGRPRARGVATSGMASGSARTRSTVRPSSEGSWPNSLGTTATTTSRREKTLRAARAPPGASTSATMRRRSSASKGRA